MSNVEILTDEDCEMIKILINGEECFIGNYWDLSTDVWVSIMQKAGVTVSERGFTYE